MDTIKGDSYLKSFISEDEMGLSSLSKKMANRGLCLDGDVQTSYADKISTKYRTLSVNNISFEDSDSNLSLHSDSVEATSFKWSQKPLSTYYKNSSKISMTGRILIKPQRIGCQTSSSAILRIGCICK